MLRNEGENELMPTPYVGKKQLRWCVYVLRCADGSYYVGVTSRLASRLRAHMRGKAAKRTANVRPLEIVAVLPVGFDRGHAWYMERRCYWAVESYPGQPLHLPEVDGWISGEVIYQRVHQLYPEVFYPGAEGLVVPLSQKESVELSAS